MLTSAMSLIKRAGAIGLGVLRASGSPTLAAGARATSRVALGAVTQSRLTPPLAAPGATPLARRTVVAVPSGAGERSASTGAKAPLEIRFFTKVGHEAVVRRAQAGDAKAIQGFLDRCEVFLRDHQASSPGLARDADDHIRLAASAQHEALVAVVQGRIVGMAITHPQGQPGQRPVDPNLLAAQGLKAARVGVSHMLVEPQARGQGIGKVLKQAQVRGAGDAGYDAVVGETISPTMMALAERIGGQVQGERMTGLTVVRTNRETKED